MSVVNVKTDTITLVANGTPVVVNRTVYQPSLDASEPAEQLLISVKLSNVPVVIPNGQTPANWALTAANNVLIPASGARQLLLTRSVLRNISYVDVSGADTGLLIGIPVSVGVATAIPAPSVFDVAVNNQPAINMVQTGVQAPANTIINPITGAAGQIAQFPAGVAELVSLGAADTTGVNRATGKLLLDADADVAGQAAISLRVTPVADASTDDKRANFTLDVFGFLLPPI